MMYGKFTRSFTNFHYQEIREQDYAGSRVILDNRYKLVITGESGSGSEKELFDIRTDPAEKINLIESKPEIAGALERQLHEWQGSVLHSLTGADYR